MLSSRLVDLFYLLYFGYCVSLKKINDSAYFRLLNGLSSERVRWIKTIKELDEAQVNLIGDIMLSACKIYFFVLVV